MDRKVIRVLGFIGVIGLYFLIDRFSPVEGFGGFIIGWFGYETVEFLTKNK